MTVANLIGIHGLKQSGKDTLRKIIQEDKTVHWKRVAFADKLKQVVCLMFGCTMKDLDNEDFKNSTVPEEWRRWFVVDKKLINLSNSGRITDYSTEEEANTQCAFYCNNWKNRFEVRNELLTYRQILQQLGTEGMRNTIHPNVHILATFSDYVYECDCENTIRLGGMQMCENCEGRDYPSWVMPDVRFENEVNEIRKRNGFLVKIKSDRVKSDGHASETLLPDKLFDLVIENNGSLEDFIITCRAFIRTFNDLKHEL